MITLKQTSSKDLVKKLFKINNCPVELTKGQVEIFDSIFHIIHPRVQAITNTQYGKSDVVSMATLLRSLAASEDFIIIAPSQSKAQIIMNYAIDHCFDNGLFLSQLQLDPNENLDRLRRERSKDKITWMRGGSIETLSLDSRNSRRKLEAAMGRGSKRIVLDESSLVDDESYATVLRMLGGHAYNEQFLFEIGNPFHRNHFYRSWIGNRHLKIFIDVYRAIRERRLSPEFVDEMKEQPLFEVLYLCKFPDEDEIDINGFRQLLKTIELESAIVDSQPICSDRIKLGVDVGGGGDESVFVLRTDDRAWVETRARSKDTMSIVVEVERIMNEYRVEAEDVFIDDIGIGRGAYDRLKEKKLAINGVNVGEHPIETQSRSRYFNQKAQYYFDAAKWVKSGGKLIKDKDWEQLLWIKYKVSSDKTIQIERKEELKKRVRRSPDTAEAFMLTFAHKKPKVKVFTP